MSSKETKGKACEACKMVTPHTREVSDINWVVHIVLGIATGGSWFIIAALIWMFSPYPSRWVCANEHESEGDEAETVAIIVVGVILCLIYINHSTIDAWIQTL